MVTLEYATAKEITISPKTVSKRLHTEEDYSTLIEELEAGLSLKACRQRFKVSYDGDTVKTAFMSEKLDTVKRYMHGCTEVILFAATVGFDVDRLIAKNSQISALKGYVTDVIASIAIEAWCDLLCARLAEEEAMKGNVLLPRFSPGYGGIDLMHQKNICEILKTRENIGLFLTDSMLLSPQKSVTAIIPVTK